MRAVIMLYAITLCPPAFHPAEPRRCAPASMQSAREPVGMHGRTCVAGEQGTSPRGRNIGSGVGSINSRNHASRDIYARRMLMNYQSRVPYSPLSRHSGESFV